MKTKITHFIIVDFMVKKFTNGYMISITKKLTEKLLQKKFKF